MKIINSNKKISATQSSKIIQKRHKCKRNQKELNQCSDNIQIDRWSQVYCCMGCMNSENFPSKFGKLSVVKGEYTTSYRYIILFGEVKVLIPKTKEEIQEEIEETEKQENEAEEKEKTSKVIKLQTQRNSKINIEVVKKEYNNYNEVAKLKAGYSFGEYALVFKAPRAATIRTTCNSYFATLANEDYQKIYGKHEEKILNEKIDFFKSMPIFCSWTRESIRRLTPFFEPAEYIKGRYVFKEGDKFDQKLYVVFKGEFEVSASKVSKENNEIEERFLRDVVKSNSGNCETENSPLFNFKNAVNSYLNQTISNQINMKDYPPKFPRPCNEFVKSIVKKERVKNKINQNYVRVGPGSFINDVFSYCKLETYNFRCKCVTKTGTLLSIATHEFYKKLKRNDSLAIHQNSVKFKHKDEIDRINSKMDLIDDCEHFAYKIETNNQLINAYISNHNYKNDVSSKDLLKSELGRFMK